jgi:toxin ParE1/3/4
MTRELRFHESAVTEIRSAAAWYEGQHPGLGEAFLDALDVRLLQLAESPWIGRPFSGASPNDPVRRAHLGRFPYMIVFLEVDDEVRVLALMHARRRPGYWRRRLAR